MTTESLPAHIDRPTLRRVHPVPLQKDNQVFLGLRDPMMLSEHTMVVPPPAFQVMQLFNGERSLAEIAQQVGMADVKPLQDLAAKLDEFGLLWGPTSEALEDKKKAALYGAGSFPALATRALGDDPAKIREQLEKWLDEAEDAEIDEPIAGIVTTHLEFQRGYPVYAASYRTIAKGPKPDRIVILGSNHQGLGDGVVVSDLSFGSPLGTMPVDAQVVGELKKRSGDALFKDILDHLPEHSIQVQILWAQHLFGNLPVVAALVPDPNVPLIADDGARLGTDQFVAVLAESLAAVGGRTLFIASANLSGAGPAYGEPAPVNDQRRRDIEKHDREMLRSYISGADGLVATLKENRNPTRWGGVGPMYAAAKLAKPSSIELLDYRQAVDEQGSVLVSSASMALLA
ncbi:MAG: AmmeMemoRadiSam system protein B [Phycisphaerales bacterium]